jgi:epoxyqueuosine reductase QueG
MKEVHPAACARARLRRLPFHHRRPARQRAHLQAWLDEKQHGEMNWLERNAPKRTDPQLSYRMREA